MRNLMIAAMAGLGLVACQERDVTPGEPEMGGVQQEERMGGTAQGETQTVTGTVAQVSGDQVSIESEQQGSMDFKLGENVAIMENGQQASREALSEGDQVRATYSGQGEQKELIQLEVMGAGQEQKQQEKQ